MDLHLNRLREGSELLFGHHLPDSLILRNMSAALAAAGSADSSLMVYISSRLGECSFVAQPADILYGVTMQILQRQFRSLGVAHTTRTISAASLDETRTSLNLWNAFDP